MNSEAIYRWKIGHRLFFFITQGLIISHLNIQKHLSQKNYKLAASAMELSTNLFETSILAFNFSSGYSREKYTNEVRPSVSPPYFESLLSGTQYIDHSEMLLQIKNCRNHLVELPIELHETYERYISSIKNLYCNHSKVCSRIVGDHHAEPAKISGQYLSRTLYYAGK